MAYNYDPNKNKATFDKMFGSGSYESGLSRANELGKQKAQLEIVRKQFNEYKSQSKKKTYDDALSYWSDPANKSKARERGADREADEIRNDPRRQQEIKDAGYNVSDFIDAMYSATSDGKFRSEREYGQFAKNQKPAWEEQLSAAALPSAQPKEEKKDKKSSLGIWDKVKNSQIGRATKAAEDFFNPFDNVKAKDAVKNYLNQKPSETFNEVARGANRAVDSASLGLMSNLDKKLNNRTPSYTSERKIGDGGGTDMITTGLGYLVPGVGSYKALNATKAGAGLTQFGSKGIGQRLASEGAKGAITGAGLSALEIGNKEALNPSDQNWKQNLTQFGIGTTGGAIADPLLYGAGKGIQSGLSRFAKGDVPSFTGKPSEEVVNSLIPQAQPKSVKTSDEMFNQLLNVQKQPEVPKPSARAFEPIESMKGNGGKMIRLKEPLPQLPTKPVKIDNPKELVKQQIDTTGKKEKTKWSFDKFMTAVVDDRRPIEKASKELGGKDLPIDKDPYKQARLASGVAGKAETFLKGGVYSPDGKKLGKSLQEIIKPYEKNMDDFLAYTVSKRALDYDEKGLIAGIKPKNVEGISDRQLAEATIKQIEAESPGIASNQQELVKYSQSLMRELKESGYYTDDAIKQIFKENPNYVPMNRVQEPKVRGFEPLPKNKYANLANPTKQRTGSEKPTINPVESIIKNTYIINNIAERNKVGVSLLELLEKAPDNAWGRVVNTSKQDNSIDNLSSILDEASTQMDDGKVDAVDNLFKGEGNKVYVYRNGEKVEMELQEDLYKAMLSLDSQKQNFFIKMLAVPAKTLRAGAVLSPDFGPVNIFRDQLSALINSKYGFVPFVDMFKGLSNVVKKDDVYWQWKNSGGANSVLASLDREYLQQDLRKLIKEPFSEKMKRNLKNPKELPLKALDAAISPLRKVSEVTEEATRLGEFKKGLKKGATPQEAAFASRDLIDFNRAGSLGRQFNQVTAFFNAAVQSMDKLARTFKENPVGASVKAVSGITLPSIVAYAYNHDQEWYKEIPQRERDLYWHFKAGDQIYKLPKPFEAGVIFGTSFERFLDFMKTDDPAAFKDFDKTVKETFTPPWLPTALAPWFDVYANKSMYFDSPIVPRREQDMLPEDQYGPYQSEIAKGLGKLTETSPRKIEHVFKGYTGGLGKYGLQISDMVAKGAGVTKPELPEKGMAGVPIVNRFVVKNLEGSNQSINDFYDKMDQLKRESQSAKKYNPNRENTSTYKKVNSIGGDISKLQAAKRAIIDDPNMSGKEKADAIKKIDFQITGLARLGNSLP